ncbi:MULTISPECIES: helix-turn-helix domain-containing protein [unclassified Streptomyces]|uniref:winged helix-turn-helix transcriptional regulator n=1 Tax=unclassified Streptomyces TaxID=2593676 RepID=UPI002366D0BA|nr:MULTISPECIES: helix-turn-helix domain-containing protein [unclassified Streptomyces]MDF3141324.1 helix-turn-helix domain-containing protein [Streptomyces sp. T21Q-yed]WDF42410.1 helix-turn-helix domain-containing protein [Streptomyces sp. T12]
MSPRRSYDQYCSAARALDLVGDRWTLLIVRELLAGPRRYTDLHADLPGVSTDVLASRLKDMEQDGLSTRRRLPPPGAAFVYELTSRGRELLPVLQALGTWGQAELGERRPTDAVRAHWFTLPLLRSLREGGVGEGLVEVRLDEGDFHLYVGAEDGPVYGDGPAPGEPDARLVLGSGTCEAFARGELSLSDAIRGGRIEVTGDGTLAKALRDI